MNETYTITKTKVVEVLDVKEEKLVSGKEVDSCCKKSKDLDLLMMQIKKNLKLAPRKEKIKLIILAP